MSFMDPNGIDASAATQVQSGDDLLNMLGNQVLDRGQMEVVMRLLSDIGNEEYRSIVMDMSSLSSGKLPSYMAEGAEGVDRSMARLKGSREYDISSSARIQDSPELGSSEFDVQDRLRLETSEVDVTVAYMDLAEAGVPIEDLDQAMTGPINAAGTMRAIAEIAEEHGAADVNMTIEAVVAQTQLEEAATVAARQEAEKLEMEIRLQQEMENPYQVGGTDPGGPAAARPV